MKEVRFSYLTLDGTIANDVIISGSVMVDEGATKDQIETACFNEACRMMREEPERVLTGTTLVIRKTAQQ